MYSWHLKMVYCQLDVLVKMVSCKVTTTEKETTLLVFQCCEATGVWECMFWEIWQQLGWALQNWRHTLDNYRWYIVNWTNSWRWSVPNDDKRTPAEVRGHQGGLGGIAVARHVGAQGASRGLGGVGHQKGVRGHQGCWGHWGGMGGWPHWTQYRVTALPLAGGAGGMRGHQAV